FPAGTASWRDGQSLRPEDVSFAPFAADYENLFRLHQQAEDDFFYVGSAYWGIPWMEAILGCPVVAAGANCRAEVCATLDVGAGGPPPVVENPWFQALLRFTAELAAFSAGRFPVCPPLLRGPGDCASAMLGGMPFVMGFHDDPDGIRELLDHCSRTRLAVIRRLHEAIPPWRGTHAAGGYPSKMWCRRTVAYNQDDCAALLSPDLFREFLLPVHQEQCSAAEVNFIHLHSSCLYPVDVLLENRCYDVLEINIDHPGGASPALPELLPALKRVQTAGRPLLLWGELTPDEWGRLRKELSPVGLSLQPIIRRTEDMPALLEVLR
ncbi:MAG TPA: hypothetical protein VM223_20845, partial [Planctomycetota bacterium]|nr:hypothetical protein [Planctomycetota bacterium]